MADDLTTRMWNAEKVNALNSLRSELRDAQLAIARVLADLDRDGKPNPSILRRAVADLFEATRFATELNTLTTHRLMTEDLT